MLFKNVISIKMLQVACNNRATVQHGTDSNNICKSLFAQRSKSSNITLTSRVYLILEHNFPLISHLCFYGGWDPCCLCTSTPCTAHIVNCIRKKGSIISFFFSQIFTFLKSCNTPNGLFISKLALQVKH